MKSFILMLAAVSAALWAAGSVAEAKPHFISGINAKPVSLKVGNAVIKGFHFVNKNGRRNRGRPVLLAHGIVLTLHEFEGIIKDRVEAGDDVYAFNFRGHGNDEERSYVTGYQEGDYRIEHLIEEDFPAMVDYIYRARGEKVSVIGHSMGAMVSLISTALGYVDGKVESLVAIASPTQTVDPVDPLQMSWRWYGSKLLNSGPGDSPLNPLILIDTLRITNFWNPLYRFVEMDALRASTRLIPDIGIASNFDPEADSWTARSVSREAPTDIIRSFDDYGWKNRGTHRYRYGQVGVPVLHIEGREDRLAPKPLILRHARAHEGEGGYWFVEVEGASHLDLVADKNARAILPFIADFQNRPTSIGPKNGTHLMVMPMQPLSDRCGLMLSSF